MTNVNCPQCGKEIHVSEKTTGTTANCIHCDEEITVPKIDDSYGTNNDRSKEFPRYIDVPIYRKLVFMVVATLLANMSIYPVLVVRSLSLFLFIVGWNVVAAITLLSCDLYYERNSKVKRFWVPARIALGILLFYWAWKMVDW